jgi:hypothetical protein
MSRRWVFREYESWKFPFHHRTSDPAKARQCVETSHRPDGGIELFMNDEPTNPKPTSLNAASADELAKLFDRAKAGEFRCIAMEYGHGRPGKPFCKIGVTWPEEKQTTLL